MKTAVCESWASINKPEGHKLSACFKQNFVSRISCQNTVEMLFKPQLSLEVHKFPSKNSGFLPLQSHGRFVCGYYVTQIVILLHLLWSQTHNLSIFLLVTNTTCWSVAPLEPAGLLFSTQNKSHFLKLISLGYYFCSLMNLNVEFFLEFAEVTKIRKESKRKTKCLRQR